MSGQLGGELYCGALCAGFALAIWFLEPKKLMPDIRGLLAGIPAIGAIYFFAAALMTFIGL